MGSAPASLADNPFLITLLLEMQTTIFLRTEMSRKTEYVHNPCFLSANILKILGVFAENQIVFFSFLIYLCCRTSEEMSMQRETIIQLAAEMFVGQGIKAVRMDDIARHIGVSKRTIYEQFGDKEELLYQCLSYYVREQDRRHAELGAQAKNVLEAMLLVFGDVMDKAEISHRLQSNLRRFYPKVYERLVAERRNRDGLEQFKIALSRGVEEGYFQGIVNFDLAITLLRYSVEGLIVRKDVLLSHNMSTNEALVFLVVNFLRGISTEKGMRLIDDFLEKQNGKK